MISFRRQLLVKLFRLSDLAIMASSVALAALPESYFGAPISVASFFSMRIKLQNAVVFVALLAAWHVVFYTAGLYQSKRLEDRKSEVFDIFKATVVGTLLLFVAGILFRIRMITPVFLIGFWGASTSITIGSRLLLRSSLAWIRIHGRNLRRILIVGTNPRAVRFARSIESKAELGYKLIGFVDEDWPGTDDFRSSGFSLIADCTHFAQFLREHIVDEVVIALPMSSCYRQASHIAAISREQGLLVHSLGNIFELDQQDIDSVHRDADAAITVSSHAFEGWPSIIKRALDVLVSVAALLILSPLFAIAAILILLDSPGPIFFVQERIGLNKRRFPMYKFRTMVADAETKQTSLEHLNEAEGPVFKIKNDPRITRLGKFLRKSSIDELPQLFNVLKGDMSLVGPRPLPIRDFNCFDQDWLRRRFSVYPGMTGLWQVNGRNSVSFQEWMKFDLHYIDHWSLWLDVKVIVKTIPAVVKGAGAV
jgi:exopolysaccharide biosynthesis polyprenyl glycosylphosphotransferase